MKKFLLGLVLLLVAVVAGLLIYVASIDWNQHKDKIARQFAEVTGKNIDFAGPVSLQLLPSPNLTASQVKIYNPGQQNQPLVVVKSLVANLALSPLLKGNVDVTRMVLVDPQINVEVSDEGQINWQYPLNAEQRRALEETEITLNSVSLQNAEVHFDMPSQDISFTLDNLNGEINAQSIFGPYRLEGNYIKDNDPEGFAISMGKLSESFATTLNLVITNPNSESYVRFDGSFLLSNRVLNGNMIVESKKLRDFLEANFKTVQLAPEYDYPLAVTMDVNVNEQQANLSNMVIKYGDTQGAGNMQIPLNDGLQKAEGAIKPRVDMAFNFTNLDLDPAVFTVKKFIQTYQDGKQSYNADFPFDMLVDIKSLKTTYNKQPVKNFETSFDVIGGMFTLNNLTATLPGETDVKIKGDLSAYEEQPFYNLDLSFNANDFLKTLNWMGLHPTVTAASTYRKALGSGKLSGTLDRIQISPFALTIDKSSLSGEAGIRLGQRPDIMLILNADAINFDNYIAALPAEEQNKSWTQRLQYRFGKLGIVKDFDMQLAAKVDLVIYENMPFDKLEAKFNLLDGRMELENLAINSVANAKMAFSGIIKGFGGVPAYENLKYNIETKDFASFINKFEFQVPNLDFKQLKNFETRGIATGSLDRFAIKNIARLEDFNLAYAGQVARQNGIFVYNGQVEAKHPDFVKMLNDFNINYNPQAFSLGLFNLKTKVTGNTKEFRANPLEFNIGFNQFSGEATMDNNGERPNLLTSLQINKLEVERFMNKDNTPASVPIKVEAAVDETNEFLKRPIWNKRRLNFNWLKNFDMSSRWDIGELSYKNWQLKNAVSDFNVAEGVLNINTLRGGYKTGTAALRLTLNPSDQNAVSGSLQVMGVETEDLPLAGSKYGITKGKALFNLTANSNAGSEEDFINNLAGSLEISIEKPLVKGWDLQAIYDDVRDRRQGAGLAALVRDKLSSGATEMNLFKGKVAFNNGNFVLSDALFSGNGVNVNLYGEGSLPQWDMDTRFDVKYDEPQWLPGYSFTLRGPMNLPQLEVNVEALIGLYKSRQDKIEAEQKAVLEAEQNRLKELAEAQKNAADVWLKEVRSGLLPKMEIQLKNVQFDQARRSLLEAQTQLEQLNSEIAANSTRGLSPELNDALIEEMTRANRGFAAAIEKIRQSMDQSELLDLRFVMKNAEDKLAVAVNEAKLLKVKFSNSQDQFNSALANIITAYKLNDDPNILGWEKFMSDKVKKLSEQASELHNRYMEMQKSTDPKVMTEYNLQLEKAAETATAEVEAMAQNLQQFNDYAEKMVAQAEADYREKLRQEEVQRKLEENTGRINIKKTGKSVTVQRDIEEIEKSEEMTAKEQIKVLDFSLPRTEKTETKSEAKSGIKKGRVIRN